MRERFPFRLVAGMLSIIRVAAFVGLAARCDRPRHVTTRQGYSRHNDGDKDNFSHNVKDHFS